MRCPYCAKKINEAKLESKQISLAAEQGNVIDPNAEVDYVCPRCGHLIHANLSEEEMKSLSQAANHIVYLLSIGQEAKRPTSTRGGLPGILCLCHPRDCRWYFSYRRSGFGHSWCL